MFKVVEWNLFIPKSKDILVDTILLGSNMLTKYFTCTIILRKKIQKKGKKVVANVSRKGNLSNSVVSKLERKPPRIESL